MTRDEREKIIWRYLLSGSLNTEQAVHQLADIWHNDVLNAEEEGYDMAAQDITMKLQSLIPANNNTVQRAMVAGAWTDAANVALNHIGHYPKRK